MFRVSIELWKHEWKFGRTFSTQSLSTDKFIWPSQMSRKVNIIWKIVPWCRFIIELNFALLFWPQALKNFADNIDLNSDHAR